ENEIGTPEGAGFASAYDLPFHADGAGLHLGNLQILQERAYIGVVEFTTVAIKDSREPSDAERGQQHRLSIAGQPDIEPGKHARKPVCEDETGSIKDRQNPNEKFDREFPPVAGLLLRKRICGGLMHCRRVAVEFSYTQSSERMC